VSFEDAFAVRPSKRCSRTGDILRHDEAFKMTPLAITTEEKNNILFTTYKYLKRGQKYNRKAAIER